ncbi:MAG: hypothetical protein QMC90_02020 [Dehalococcoidales bacterium]|nr:hypothetical protein [Dehalococcoidales bacterium]
MKEERKDKQEERINELTINLKNIVDNILDSYEKRVKVVARVMKETTRVLKRLSTEQAKMALKLRNTLAKRQSLRKADFDGFLEDIVLRSLDKEKRVNQVVENFQKEGEEMIARMRDTLAGREKIKPSDFKLLSKTILDRLSQREKEVSEMMRNFHIEQEELSAGLRYLVEKGDEVKTKDLKAVTESIRLRQLERSSEIGKMLGELERVQQEINLRWGDVLKNYT